MKIVREEIFGPFVVIQSFKTEEEVVGKANDSEYGFGAVVCTKDIVRGHRVTGAINAGILWVSCPRVPCINSPDTDDSVDQKLKRLGFRNSVWRIQAERHREGAGCVRVVGVYAGQGCACQLGHFSVELARNPIMCDSHSVLRLRIGSRDWCIVQVCAGEQW